ncbi:FAD-binding protein, partial [Francisella tularensis subsp. holarctica]|uniref:FAD-binding protein n=1 Tax=Francisella tularensis TaxID=263 RepID=UPI002381B6C3
TDFYSELFAVDLVKAYDGSIAVVLALCIETGETFFLKAKITILATGGSGRIYESSTNSYINTVDGMGLSLRDGLPL